MENFLCTNPGLRSRIAYHIPFADYGDTELLEILQLMMAKKKYTFSDTAEEKLLKIFRQATESQNFGNGRFVRNLLERATMRQATRFIERGLETIAEHEKNLLEADDFEPLPLGKTQSTIGFL